MLALAVYEAFTPAGKRARMGDIIRRVETRRVGRATGEEKDPLGNVMVESIQQLSGLNKSKKKVKPKKPTSLRGLCALPVLPLSSVPLVYGPLVISKCRHHLRSLTVLF